MTFGEILDYLSGYEMREARANHRARMVMMAMNGLSPEENWELPALDQEQKGEEDFFSFMQTITPR